MSVGFNAAILQLLGVTLVWMMIGWEGELAEGCALQWFFSLPLTVAVGLAASGLFPPYLASRHRFGIYLAIVLSAGLLGPALAHAIMMMGFDLVWT